jgi:predicted DNA-binding transcriptional regulator AlpA
LNVAEVAQRFRITKRAIQMRVRKGTFPQPYRFGKNQALWAIEDLEKYEQASAPTMDLKPLNRL